MGLKAKTIQVTRSTLGEFFDASVKGKQKKRTLVVSKAKTKRQDAEKEIALGNFFDAW